MISVAVSPIHQVLSWIVGVILFWTLIVKWFNVDLFGALIIVLVNWVVSLFLTGMLIAALMHVL